MWETAFLIKMIEHINEYHRLKKIDQETDYSKAESSEVKCLLENIKDQAILAEHYKKKARDLLDIPHDSMEDLFDSLTEM